MTDHYETRCPSCGGSDEQGCYADCPTTVIAALRAENERLRVQNIQMQAALGYGIMAEDERHILPSNPYKCGTCDANKHIRAENERLRAALEKMQRSRDRYRQAWEAEKARSRAALEEK